MAERFVDRLTGAVSASPENGLAVPFSLEFMPPRDEAGEARLWRAIRIFEGMRPAFVSVTYGAGGSTRDRTVRVTGEIAETTTLIPVAHLTAVNHTVAELRALVGAYADRGISNILALRGDPPGDPLGDWVKCPGGVEYAEELVDLVSGLGDFSVGVAAFPEGHYRAVSLAADTDNLVRKFRAGADYAITQMFFRTADYLGLRDRVLAQAPEYASTPIIPSIMPVTSLRSVARMVELSGATIPAEVLDRFERAAAAPGPDASIVDGENRAEVRKVGIELATELSEQLIAEGAPALHFCTMNLTAATTAVLQNLGLQLAGAALAAK